MLRTPFEASVSHKPVLASRPRSMLGFQSAQLSYPHRHLCKEEEEMLLNSGLCSGAGMRILSEVRPLSLVDNSRYNNQ